jgi:hypothetical protein
VHSKFIVSSHFLVYLEPNTAKMTKSYLRKLSSLGYSIIPVDENKRPIGAWKKYQTEARSPDEVEQLDSPLYGLVTGVNDLEVIDVDLKVLVGLQEQKAWWRVYISFIEDNIEDFADKVVIAKTKNAGFHILYKCKNVGTNTKIATPEGSSEAIIESRGTGGMVVIYENFLTDKQYHDIKYITNEERDIIWAISRTFNHIEEQTIDEPKKSDYKATNETDITPWAEYNDRHTALDLISDDFTIVRNTSTRYIIKRNGATSPHSGYVYKDSGCMYLFTTGTIYPNEKLISPFMIYAYKYHGGNTTEAARDLYQQGYGSRKAPKVEIKAEISEIIDRIQFPLDIFPEDLQKYIVHSANTLGLSTDYMGSAFIWLTSVIIGNALKIEVKPGWQETATVWIAIVGKPGIGKTPSINQMIYPLREANVKEQKEYVKQYAKWKEYEALDKKEKQYAEEIDKPVSKQFLVGDITLEALVDLHEQNPNAIGVFKDELAGWFKDMNKYRQGSDLEFWLSSWSGTSISLNRKTSKSAFVDKPFIPVLGGIQPSVFEEFTTGNNKENGFVDRILISYPELSVNHYNNEHMDEDVIEWYRAFVMNFRDVVNKKLLKFNERAEIESIVAKFNNKAKAEWIRIHDKITDIQNSEDENEYMKSMLPKQKSYIPRFALILNTIWSIVEDEYQVATIQVDSIKRAERLSEYFINMSKLVKMDVKEKNNLRVLAKTTGSLSEFEQFKAMYKANPNLNRTTASEILEVSKRIIYKWIKKIEE